MKRKKELNYNWEAQALQRELVFANETICELREQVKKKTRELHQRDEHLGAFVDQVKDLSNDLMVAHARISLLKDEIADLKRGGL